MELTARLACALAGCLLLLLTHASPLAANESLRVRRQARREAPAAAEASAAVTSSAAQAPPAAVQPDRRPANSARPPAQPDPQPAGRPLRVNRPDEPERRGNGDRDRHAQRNRDRDERDDDYDCYDGYDYDYSRQFLQMAANPMRQIGRMMDDMLGRMAPANYAPGDYDNFSPDSPGASAVSSSAFGTSDGYSRLSSTVNSNGRTRGIVSETRNGRTQTRRIGDDEDEADE